MDVFGFVPPPLIPLAAQQVAGFIGLATATIAGTLGVKAAFQAATVKEPQSSVGGDISFEPWGDDPYERPEPEPVRSTAPLAETSAPVIAPPETPVQLPETAEEHESSKDPQAPLTTSFVPTPIPTPPGNAQTLGGYFWSYDLGGDPVLGLKVRLRYGNYSSEKLTLHWSALRWEVKEVLVDGQYQYQPQLRVLNSEQTTFLWIPIDPQIEVPQVSTYHATVYIPLSDGSEDVLDLDEFLEITERNPFPNTFTPPVLPPKQTAIPETETETSSFVPAPIPGPQPDPDTEEKEVPLAPPLIVPPVVVPEIDTSKNFVPLPSLPGTPVYLDPEGRPVQPTRPLVTSPTGHVIDTPDGPVTVPGVGASPNPANIAAELQRVEGKAAQILKNTNLGGGILDRLPEILLLLQGLADLLEQPLPAQEYTIHGICEEPLEDGRQPSTTVILPPEMWADRVISQVNALPELLQAHLGYKTPICTHDTPAPEGDYRTISFRSDQVSPYGKSRLRKRFRYRSVSGNDLGAVVDHWKDFVWEGGPYRVRWIGGSWGPVEVWAASEAEGKRVIQHAAAEAGFDPFESGRWSTRISGSTRLGVSGTMRVDTTGGYYWITARDGSNQRPTVALT